MTAWYSTLFSQHSEGDVWEYFMLYCWVVGFFFWWRFNKLFLIIVYPFFKIQIKITGFISVICFMERCKYYSFAITKKRCCPRKRTFYLQFLKFRRFLWNGDCFLRGNRKLVDSLCKIKDSCTVWPILDDCIPKWLQLKNILHNHNIINVANSIPKKIFPACTPEHLFERINTVVCVIVVTSPVLLISTCSTKPFTADFTWATRAIMTKAFLWDCWNKHHTQVL